MQANRVALVTGGARGIGRAIAKRLASDGLAVAVNYKSDGEAASRVVEDIRGAGGTASAFQADITDMVANRGLFAEVVASWGRLDILVNNAGVAAFGPFSALDEAGYDRLAAVAKGSYFAMQNAVAHLSAGGRIINISTSLTRDWPTYMGAYAGSKAAIEQFTRALSKEAGARGITVNAILAGFVNTELNGPLPEEQLEALRQLTSIGRLGEPEDIADVVAFIASEGARWITGQCIGANGGSTP